MSLPSSTDNSIPEPAAPIGPVGPARQFRKPRADIYTVLLVVSLVAIILAILCLYLEMKDYGFEFKGGPSPARATSPISPIAVARCEAASGTGHYPLSTIHYPLSTIHCVSKDARSTSRLL